MDQADEDNILWYLNEYDGALPKAHATLKGADADKLREAIAGMDAGKVSALAATSRNIRAAHKTAESAEGDAYKVNSIEDMHKTCKCLSNIMAYPKSVTEEKYGKTVAGLVGCMLHDLKEVQPGKCSRCKAGAIMRKYRRKLFNALRSEKRC